MATQKYGPIKSEQKKKAAKDLENQVKRAVRDDPKFIKELG